MVCGPPFVPLSWAPLTLGVSLWGVGGTESWCGCSLVGEIRGAGRASCHGEGFGSSYTGRGKPGEGFKREKMGLAAVQRVMSGGTRVEAGR